MLSNSEHLSQFSVELQTALVAVKKAANAIAQTEISDSVKEKSDGVNDFVTAWDTVGQQVISDELIKKFPGDKILGEESDMFVENPAQQERLWVIDPIDGTANAKAGRKYSFISLGFTQEGKSIAGVVYDPYHDDIYYAEKGKGAFKNGEKIEVSKNTTAEKAAINTDMGFINEVSNLHQDMLKTYGSPTRRMMGSAIGEMLEVATGTADIFFYTCIKPWDNAAVFSILEESGAIVQGTDGRDINFTSMDVVVGNPTLVNDFVERVGKPYKDQIKKVQDIFLQKNPTLSPIVSGL